MPGILQAHAARIIAVACFGQISSLFCDWEDVTQDLWKSPCVFDKISFVLCMWTFSFHLHWIVDISFCLSREEADRWSCQNLWLLLPTVSILPSVFNFTVHLILGMGGSNQRINDLSKCCCYCLVCWWVLLPAIYYFLRSSCSCSPSYSRNSDAGLLGRLFSPLPTAERALHFHRQNISALSSLVGSRRIVPSTHAIIGAIYTLHTEIRTLDLDLSSIRSLDPRGECKIELLTTLIEGLN